jgi:predicted membrane channel-forming protein YqfA (hemolysin III family)
MPVDEKDILVADSSIISGVLILLTIAESASSSYFLGVIRPVGLAIFGLGIVVLFSVSAFYALESNKLKAIRFAKYGFLSVIVLLASLAVFGAFTTKS